MDQSVNGLVHVISCRHLFLYRRFDYKKKMTPKLIEVGVSVMDDFSSSVICKPSILQTEYGGDRYFKTNQCLIVVIHYFF